MHRYNKDISSLNSVQFANDLSNYGIASRWLTAMLSSKENAAEVYPTQLEWEGLIRHNKEWKTIFLCETFVNEERLHV